MYESIHPLVLDIFLQLQAIGSVFISDADTLPFRDLMFRKYEASRTSLRNVAQDYSVVPAAAPPSTANPCTFIGKIFEVDSRHAPCSAIDSCLLLTYNAPGESHAIANISVDVAKDVCSMGKVIHAPSSGALPQSRSTPLKVRSAFTILGAVTSFRLSITEQVAWMSFDISEPLRDILLEEAASY